MPAKCDCGCSFMVSGMFRFGERAVPRRLNIKIILMVWHEPQDTPLLVFCGDCACRSWRSGCSIVQENDPCGRYGTSCDKMKEYKIL